MNLLILGATGGTGRALVEQALEQGHTVTAFARDPSKVRASKAQATHPNLRVAQGDISNYASLEAAIRGQDAVLSGLGVRVNVAPLIVILILCQVVAKLAHLTGAVGLLVRIGIPVLADLVLFRPTTMLSEGTKNIIRAMDAQGVKRFVSESSLGVGDSKDQPRFSFKYILLPVLLRNIFKDKEVQEKAIQASDLDWVIVRPTALSNGPRTGVYRSGFAVTDKSIRGSISRADVADFMLAQVTSDAYVRKAPGVSY